MAVEERTNTPEQNAQDGNARKEAEGAVKKGILDSIDLSAEEEKFGPQGGNKGEGQGKEGESAEGGEGEGASEGAEGEGTEGAEGQEGEGQEGEGVEGQEGEGEEGEEDLSPDGEGDEVVSKKKVAKRIGSLTSQVKILTERLNTKEAKEAEAAQETDPDVKRLNAMSQDGLKATKRAVIVEIAKATHDGDTDRVSKLVDLQEKVDTAIQNAPQRFIGKQVDAYNKVADDIFTLGEIPMTKDAALELKAIAREVYQSNPELHNLLGGQALALKHAYALYKATLSKSAGKENADGLKRQVNNLKKKTGLESGGLKKTVTNKGKDVTKLRTAARGGTTNDKLNLIKEDPAFGLDSLIPEEYKEGA